MKKFLFICLLSASTANAQWKFPAFTSIGDTSFYRIDADLELALAGFKDVLAYNYFTFDKKKLHGKIPHHVLHVLRG